MKQEDEQGFLSGKFDDWSGEPIPNGWNSIENKIQGQRRKSYLIQAGIPLLALLSWFAADNLRLPQEKAGTRSNLVAGIQKPNSSAEQKGNRTEKSGLRNSATKPAETPDAADASLSDKLVSNSALDKSAQEIPESFGEFIPNQTTSIISRKEQHHPGIGELIAISSEKEDGELRQQDSQADPMAIEKASGFLASRTPAFHFEPALAEAGKPLHPELSSRSISPKGWYNRFFTIQASWAVSQIEINHANSDLWKYSAANAGFSKAGTFSLGFRLEKPLQRTTALLYGLEAGVFIRHTETNSQYKVPVSYQLISQGNSRYQVLAEQESPVSETRESMMAYAKAELGLRQALTRNSGFLATASLWTRLASASRSSLTNSAEFRNESSSVAAGGRIGYWLQTGPFTRLEFSCSTLPEHLAPQTQSLNFRTTALGLSLTQGI